MATPRDEYRSGGQSISTARTWAALKNLEKQQEWERKDAKKQMWYFNEALGITA